MRLIDADAFKQKIAAYVIRNNIIPEKANKMCELIDMQPTASHWRWIPIEEHLPGPGLYLVSCDDKAYPVKRMRMKGVCFYDHEGIYDGKVYAWMPLPEPYRKEKEEEV